MEPQELRRVMGHFATGVTVITTIDKAGTPNGLTANAFMSLSLDPPLIVISVDKGRDVLCVLRIAKRLYGEFSERRARRDLAPLRHQRRRQVRRAAMAPRQQRRGDHRRRLGLRRVSRLPNAMMAAITPSLWVKSSMSTPPVNGRCFSSRVNISAYRIKKSRVRSQRLEFKLKTPDPRL